MGPPPGGGGLTARGGKADREPRQGEGSSETISRVAFAKFFFCSSVFKIYCLILINFGQKDRPHYQGSPA